MGKRFLGETPRERASNIAWLQRVGAVCGIAVFFGLVRWLRMPDGREFAERFVGMLPDMSFMGPIAGGAAAVTLLLLALAAAVIIPLMLLWMLVRFIRSAWYS